MNTIHSISSQTTTPNNFTPKNIYDNHTNNSVGVTNYDYRAPALISTKAFNQNTEVDGNSFSPNSANSTSNANHINKLTPTDKLALQAIRSYDKIGEYKKRNLFMLNPANYFLNLIAQDSYATKQGCSELSDKLHAKREFSNRTGYPSIKLGNQHRAISRILFLIAHPENQDNRKLRVKHLCGNVHCVNLAHLGYMQSGNAKLQAADYDAIIELYNSGESITEIARAYNIHSSTVSLIITGKRGYDRFTTVKVQKRNKTTAATKAAKVVETTKVAAKTAKREAESIKTPVETTIKTEVAATTAAVTTQREATARKIIASVVKGENLYSSWNSINNAKVASEIANNKQIFAQRAHEQAQKLALAAEQKEAQINAEINEILMQEALSEETMIDVAMTNEHETLPELSHNALMSKIEKHSDVTQNGCQIWLGTMRKYGEESAGQISSAGIVYVNKIKIPVHELIWKSYNGQIPKGDLIIRTCKNERCFNIHHLALKTVAAQDVIPTNQFGLTEYETQVIKKSPELYSVLAKRYRINQSVVKAIKAELSMTAGAR